MPFKICVVVGFWNTKLSEEQVIVYWKKWKQWLQVSQEIKRTPEHCVYRGNKSLFSEAASSACFAKF